MIAANMLTLLTFLAPAVSLVGAAPLHHQQSRDNNMANFASAMIEIATGGKVFGVSGIPSKYDVGSSVDPDTTRIRTRAMDASLLQVCNQAYSNSDGKCQAISAFAATAWFGYQREMTGGELFAGLTQERVDKMQTAINDFCGTGSYNYGCAFMGNGFNSFAATSGTVQPGQYTDVLSQVALLDLIDGHTSNMKRGLLGSGKAQQNSVGPLDVNSLLGGVIKRDDSDLGLNVDLDANVDLNTRVTAIVNALLQAKLGRRDLNADANVDVNANVDLDAKITAIVNALLQAKLGRRQIGLGGNAAADVNVNANADLGLSLGRRAQKSGPPATANIAVSPTNDDHVFAGANGAYTSTFADHDGKAGTLAHVDNKREITGESSKRASYNYGGYNVTVNNDGQGNLMESVESDRVNVSSQASPDGASYSVDLPNSVLDQIMGQGDGSDPSTGNAAGQMLPRGTIGGAAVGGMAGYGMSNGKGSLENTAGVIGASSDAGVKTTQAGAPYGSLAKKDNLEVEERQLNGLLGALPLGNLLGGGATSNAKPQAKAPTTNNSHTQLPKRGLPTSPMTDMDVRKRHSRSRARQAMGRT